MAITIPRTQKAAIVEKPGKNAKAVLTDIPVDDPQEGEVLIKMTATGVCHTDLHLQKDDWAPQMSMRCPVGGHEGVGKIVKLGPGVTNLKMYVQSQCLIVAARQLVSKRCGRSAKNAMNVLLERTRYALMPFPREHIKTGPFKNTLLAPLATSPPSPMSLIHVWQHLSWYVVFYIINKVRWSNCV